MVEHKTAVNLPHSEAEAIFQLMLESKGITAQPTEMEKKYIYIFFGVQTPKSTFIQKADILCKRGYDFIFRVGSRMENQVHVVRFTSV